MSDYNVFMIWVFGILVVFELSCIRVHLLKIRNMLAGRKEHEDG